MSASRFSWKLTLVTCGVLLLGLAGYNYFARYCTAPVHLTLSGGNVCPLRTEMAAQICKSVASEGIVLEAVAGSSSDATCAKVDAHKLDLGLVLGGFPIGKYKHVRQVAALGVEPLHLLVRPELAAAAGSQPSLEMLRGRRVSLGERGSNGAYLAVDLLRLARLRPSTPDQSGDFEPLYVHEADLTSQLRTWARAAESVRAVLTERMPDALFLVDNLPSPLVDELVQTAGYQLVPLPFAQALHLDGRRDHAHTGHVLDASRIEPAKIPAYTYGLSPAMPPQDCPTFGLRLLLVAHKDVPTNAINRLLRALDKHAAARYQINLDAGNANQEFPLHPGAVAFASGRRPMVIGELLEPLGNLLSVIGAGAAGVLALWGFVRGLRRVNPDVHLRQIDRIERLLQGREQDDAAPLLPADFIDYLETRLADVKEAAIEDFASGRLQNSDSLVSILTLVADTRHLLAQRRKSLAAVEHSSPARPNRLVNAA